MSATDLSVSPKTAMAFTAMSTGTSVSTRRHDWKGSHKTAHSASVINPWRTLALRRQSARPAAPGVR
eukprot:scaffold89200_cov79-Phaeocystis_antarctica.AAC.1